RRASIGWCASGWPRRRCSASAIGRPCTPSTRAGSWYSWPETVPALSSNYPPLPTSGRSVTLSCATRGRRTATRAVLLAPHRPGLRRRPLDLVDQAVSRQRQVDVGIEISGIAHRVDEALVGLRDVAR